MASPGVKRSKDSLIKCKLGMLGMGLHNDITAHFSCYITIVQRFLT